MSFKQPQRRKLSAPEVKTKVEPYMKIYKINGRHARQRNKFLIHRQFIEIRIDFRENYQVTC